MELNFSALRFCVSGNARTDIGVWDDIKLKVSPTPAVFRVLDYLVSGFNEGK